MYTLEHLYRSKIFLPTISLVVLKLPSNNICHRYPHAQRLVYSLSLCSNSIYPFSLAQTIDATGVCVQLLFFLFSPSISLFSLSLSLPPFLSYRSIEQA